ncbi:hypothetical protein [Phenylobacterium sp.]|nr:hypothetical protein [Phenylobacterium sp.]
MKRRTVVLTPHAADDLASLGMWIAEAASVDVALRYVARIEAYED